MGARKIIVVNVGPIGCIPYQRDVNPNAGDNCVDFTNQLAQSFNAQLRSLVTELSTNLQGSQFVYADVYHIVDDILQNFMSYGMNVLDFTAHIRVRTFNLLYILNRIFLICSTGFENANSACCRVAGRFGGLIPCGSPSKVCEDRSKFVFWDPYHPSDAANVIVARRLMDGDSSDITPINIRQLAEL